MPQTEICPECGGEINIGDWPFCDGNPEAHQPVLRIPHSVAQKERTVVYRDPRTGHVVYPGRNDRPMPKMYSKAGYERVDFPTLRSLDKFCESRGILNEKAHYDSEAPMPSSPDIPPETAKLIKEGKIKLSAKEYSG